MFSSENYLSTKMAQIGGAQGAAAEPGFIYVIQEGLDQCFKVGVSKDPVSRVNQLQTGNYRRLKLRYFKPVDDMSAAEDEAHQRLGDLRIQEGGGKEWFRGEYQNIEEQVNEVYTNHPGD